MIYLLLLISLTFSTTFHTQIGKCTMEIYDGKINNIPELIDIIKSETKILVSDLGQVTQKPFSIHITNDLNKFNEIAGPVPEWGIAVAKNKSNKIIMQSPNVAKISYSKFKKVLKHELNHIYIFQIPQYETIPSWFKEGIAMYYSNEFSILHKIELSHFLWKKKIVPLIKLKNINKHGNITLQYAESAAAIESLIYYYGENVIIKIFNNLHLNQNFELALENAINKTYIDFQINYHSFLTDNYKWVFLLRSGKHFFVILPFILIFGFYYKSYKNKKILKLWELEEKLDN